MSSTKGNESGKTVVVGLSGRVDSAVAAYLLKKQGYNVIGVTILTVQDDLVANPKYLPKCHVTDLDKVKHFCNTIGIAFYATDAKSRYEYEVIDNFVAGRLAARANSTCLNCTKLRLKVLFEKMKQLKADFIATGHYAKVLKNINTNQYFIHSNNDVASDQSYLLGGLSKEILGNLLLPLGELRQIDVIKIARRFSLEVMASKTQEGYCLKDAAETEKIIRKCVPKSMVKDAQAFNKETGSFAGDHKGIAFHYVTENNLKFENISHVDKELEIVDYDFHTGIIQIGEKHNLAYKGTEIVHLWVSEGVDTSSPIRCFFKFKHSSEFNACTLFFKNNNTAYVEFTSEIYPIINYEQLVFFDTKDRGSKIIGTGLVGRRGKFKMVDRVVEFRRSKDEDVQAATNSEEEEKTGQIFKF